MLRIGVSILLLAAIATVAPMAMAAEPETHIVFLAGPKDHGVAGRHEYEADLRVELNPDAAANRADPSTPRRAAAQARASFEALDYRFGTGTTG